MTAIPEWDDLGDDELAARLAHHGADPVEAATLVADRDRSTAARSRISFLLSG